jgi:ABC-2 type transport system ATP-binding protein
MPDDGVAVSFRGIVKRYGRTTAVDGVDLEIRGGQVFGLLGPNGAGKTSLIKMLMGLTRPTAGSVHLFGKSTSDPHTRERVGFLPEHFRFHEWLTAQEFLTFHGGLYGMPAAGLRLRIPIVLEQVGLARRAGSLLGTFSKGMLQRIGIAQALLNDPLLLVLDEPTSGLDPVGRRDVRDLILELRRAGVAVLLNSHILSEVERVSDEVAILDLGRVVWRGRPTELPCERFNVTARVDRVGEELVRKLQEVAPDVTVEDRTLRFSVVDEEGVARAAQVIIDGGGRLYRLEPVQPSLEDLFVSLVRGRDQ